MTHPRLRFDCRCALLVVSSAVAALQPRGVLAEPPPPEQAAAIDSLRLATALARIGAEDALGLGARATEMRTWIGDKHPISLRHEGDAWKLARGDGATRDVSSALGVALGRFLQYANVTWAARTSPITFDELKAAVLDEGSVSRIRGVFDEALKQRVVLDDVVLIPELGGEATVDGGLQLAPLADPTREALGRIAEARADPERVGRILAGDPEVAGLLDESGQLTSEVALWKARGARGVPEARRRHAWNQAVRAVLTSASDAFVMRPKEQLEAIISRDWSGRFVGAWHVHPPALTPGGYVAGAVPSGDDVEVARSTGQFLTIAFRPDGFDAYDLAHLVGDDPTAAPRIEYRSEDWRRHFEAARRALPGG